MISGAPADPLRTSVLGTVQAVLVTYDSGPEVLRLCQAVLDEVDGLVIVDNGSPAGLMTRLEDVKRAYAPRVEIVANAQNRGLAAAQNQGIEAAIRKKADWILLLDDDSLPVPGLVAAFGKALASVPDRERVALLAAAIRQPPEAGDTR